MKREGEIPQVPRLRRIGNSKEPTPRRMLAIASNLRALLDTYISVSATANFYDHSNGGSMEYDLWIASRGEHERFETWSDLLGFYRKIMKEGLEGV